MTEGGVVATNDADEGDLVSFSTNVSSEEGEFKLLALETKSNVSARANMPTVAKKTVEKTEDCGEEGG